MKIKTENEYNERMKVFSKLMDKGDSLTEEEADYMDLLGTLLEDYEHTVHPELVEKETYVPTPAEAVKWAMDRHGLTAEDLEQYIGGAKTVAAVLDGSRLPTRTMVIKLHDGLGIPYEHLLGETSPKTYRKVAMF